MQICNQIKKITLQTVFDMSIPLRDYQKECLNVVLREHSSGINQQLIILPTGSGKTIVMAAIAKHFNKKTLLLAHREELINQAVEKFKLFWPDVDIGICMADRDDVDRQIVIGSVQSCSRIKRLDRLKEKGFELLMIDEAHHSASDSYQSVISALGFECDSKNLLLGVTATPQRSEQAWPWRYFYPRHFQPIDFDHDQRWISFPNNRQKNTHEFLISENQQQQRRLCH